MRTRNHTDIYTAVCGEHFATRDSRVLHERHCPNCQATDQSGLEACVLYWGRCKRNNQLVVLSWYGIDAGVRATDPNCFRQLLSDYEVMEPVLVPAHVMDWLSTKNIEAAAE